MRMRTGLRVTRRSLGRLVTLGAGLAALAVGIACGTNFEPASLVDSVRILATQADHPYATPGQTVSLQMLAYDGRVIQPEPMKVWWLPFVCINPIDDLYYDCFAGLAADGGIAPDSGLGAPDGGAPPPLLKPGVDLTPLLIEGTKFSLTLPANIISAHATKPNIEPYGLAIAFNIACAGLVEAVPVDPTSDNPIQIPIGCFDKNEIKLDPSAYVIGFTRVYAYTTWTNNNPVIQQVTFDGGAVPDSGLTVPHCTASKLQDCQAYSLDTVVPSSSDEVDPSDLGPNGMPRNEEIWVDYFTTQGALDDDARLLYDPVQGQITSTATKYHAPQAPGPAVLWAVVHDNRDGTSWQQIPVTVQ